MTDSDPIPIRPAGAEPPVTIDAGAEEAGSRIDRFLGNRFYPAYSRSFLTDLIAAGEIQVNGRKVRPAYRLAAGDRIEAHLAPRTAQSPVPEDLPLRVLYEDPHVLVVDKPAGMVVHPGSNVSHGTLANVLLHRYPELAKVGLVDRPGIVHRLDGNTSGAMVVARTNPARVHLVEQFKAKRVRKEYRALVVGVMPLDSDYVDLPLGPDPRRPERMAVLQDEGKPSSTFYEVLDRFPKPGPGASWVAAMPHTGRTHQIRVHLAHVGFPVMNDAVYGHNQGQAWQNLRKQRELKGEPLPELKRHALHAFRLTFQHPVTLEEATFESPLPDDMAGMLRFYRAENGRF